RYGVGAGASRLVSGSLRPHRELEERLAAFKRVEAALVFPTGYQANLGLITTLAEDCSVLYADRLCHASLIDACRLCDAPLRVYRHRDHAQLTRLLQRGRAPHPALVVTDGVFSMDGDLAPLPELDKVGEQAGVRVVVDDADGTGGRGQAGFDALDSRSPIIPLLIGDAEATLRLSETLLAHGIYAPAIRPPTVPAGTSRIRLSVTAGHTPAQIDHLLEVLQKICASDDGLRERLRGAQAGKRRTETPPPS